MHPIMSILVHRIGFNAAVRMLKNNNFPFYATYFLCFGKLPRR